MDPSFQIRRGTAADIPIIAYHRLGMMTEMGIGDEAAWHAYEKEFAVFATRELASGAYNQWLVENESGEVVAGGAVFIIPWPANPKERLQKRAFILNVYTEPAYRRHGIARVLVQTMTAWCRAQGFRSVRLHASDMGRPLYQSLGFEVTREMRLAL